MPQSNPEQSVPRALRNIEKRDTLDVYGRRLRGTSALVSRAGAMLGVPTGLAATLAGPQLYGAERLLTTPLYLAGGAVIATGVYGVQRMTEKKRARKAEANQQIIRDTLDEPVDVIRNKRRRTRKNGVTLRWYGADTEFAATDTDSGRLARFADVLDFAQTHNIKEVVASADLFGSPQERPANLSQLAAICDQVTFFKDKKGSRIKDTKSDQELVRIPVAKAKEILEVLGHTNEVSKIKILAEQLIKSSSEQHPIAGAYKNWTQFRYHAEFRARMAEIVRMGLERRLGSATRTKLARLDEGGRLVGFAEARTSTAVMVTPRGVHELTTTMEVTNAKKKGEKNSGSEEKVQTVDVEDNAKKKGQGPATAQGHLFSGFENFTGGEDIAVFADKIAHIAQECAKKGVKKFQPHNIWEVELALYYYLNKHKDETLQARTAAQGQIQSATHPDTLYARLADERPRAPLKLRKFGKGASRLDHTIEYGKRLKRNWAKKLGTCSLAVALGGGIGIGLERAQYAYDSGYQGYDLCSEESLQRSELSKDDRAQRIEYCENPIWDILRPFDTIADKAVDMNDGIENKVLIQAYKAGLLEEGNLQFFADKVTSEWKHKKWDQLNQMVNLYGERSQYGDVEVESNPALWSLTPKFGATAKGYWVEQVHNEIFVDERALYDSATPPYTDMTISNNTHIPSLDFSLRKPLEVVGYDFRELRQKPRKVELLSTEELGERPVIEVRGRRLPTRATKRMVIVDSSGERQYVNSLAVPVIAGGDIVAAKITLRDLGTDEILIDPLTSPTIYQLQDGTYAIIQDESLESAKSLQEGYLDVSYTIDPHAKSDLPVRATQPLVVSRYKEGGTPLAKLLTPKDEAAMKAKLGLPADASIEQTAAAVSRTRDYNYTPYKAGKVVGTEIGLEAQTHEIVMRTGKTAEEMAQANCNVASYIGLLATRGQDKDGYVNQVSGFRNDGDTLLSKAESHVFWARNTATRTGDSNFVDATPSAFNQDEPQVETFQESPKSDVNVLKMGAQVLAAGAAFTVGNVLGVRATPPAVAYVRRRRREQAYETLATAIPSQLHDDISTLEYLRYAPESATLDPAQPPAHFSRRHQDDPVARAQSFAGWSPKDAGALILQRERSGTVSMAPEMKKRLMNLVAAANRAW